jgi:hypothetical protein
MLKKTSVLKIKTVCFFETLTSAYESSQHQNPNNNNIILCTSNLTRQRSGRSIQALSIWTVLIPRDTTADLLRGEGAPG